MNAVEDENSADGSELTAAPLSPDDAQVHNTEAMGDNSKNDAFSVLDEEFGLLTSAEVSELTGMSVGDVFDKHTRGQLFAVVRDGKWLYPAFQFDPVEHGVYPVITELIRTAEAYGRSESGLALWMVFPNDYLDGFRPVDCLNTPDTVRICAEASFKPQW